MTAGIDAENFAEAADEGRTAHPRHLAGRLPAYSSNGAKVTRTPSSVSNSESERPLDRCQRAPLSVIIPTLNAAAGLPATLAALAPAAVSGLIREVILVDGGSTDATCAIAEAAGARVLLAPPGRGGQIKTGADTARGDWLLVLHADTALGAGWPDEAGAFMRAGKARAAVFTLAFDAKGLGPKIVSAGAMLRTRLFASPYGDQGLLIARTLYDAVGGYRALPLMEDVDLIDRLRRFGGRRALAVLKARAITSASRYERDGYARRVLKNACCLLMHRLGVAPEKIAAFYR
ncbi:MAG: TIGR04283 family arsenosugar biosynthesis glycosyltransferase [Parvularculaceae bacterium]